MPQSNSMSIATWPSASPTAATGTPFFTPPNPSPLELYGIGLEAALDEIAREATI